MSSISKDAPRAVPPAVLLAGRAAGILAGRLSSLRTLQLSLQHQPSAIQVSLASLFRSDSRCLGTDNMDKQPLLNVYLNITTY